MIHTIPYSLRKEKQKIAEEINATVISLNMRRHKITCMHSSHTERGVSDKLISETNSNHPA